MPQNGQKTGLITSHTKQKKKKLFTEGQYSLLFCCCLVDF